MYSSFHHHPCAPRYVRLWHNRHITSEAMDIDMMLHYLLQAANELSEMSVAGVILDPDSDIVDDCARLVTTDPHVAERFDFDPEDHLANKVLDYDDGDLDDEKVDDETPGCSPGLVQ